MSKNTKPHIGIFGRRNTGKSSIINTITQQYTAIVSDIAGTTTDPVKKSVEIFGVGPAIIIDTAGIDDIGTLGEQRIKKTLEITNHIDIAILVFSNNTFGEYEYNLIQQFTKLDTPYIIVHNKSDLEKLNHQTINHIQNDYNKSIIEISSKEKLGIEKLIETIKIEIPKSVYVTPSLFEGLINKGETIVLVTPIDSEAPEGRMILPQVMAIRNVLDADCICVVLKDTQLRQYLEKNTNISLIVTDSQVFKEISKIVPNTIPLTSFSVLLSRLKGYFDEIVEGTKMIDKLKNGDKILILESCTHQVSCEDIGRFKLPKWLTEYTKKELIFEVVSGLQDFEKQLDNCAFLIQCGGCMATKKQVQNRFKMAINKNIPISNYGMSIAYINGIFDRITQVFEKTNKNIS